MSIKLNGSSAGSVSFDAPADTSPTGTDVTLTLPTSAGSAGQYLRNSGTAGTLEFASLPDNFNEVNAVTLSGSAVSWTGLPSTTYRIAITVSDFSLDVDVDPVVRLGTSSGYITSGYQGAAAYLGDLNQGTQFLSGFGLTDTGSSLTNTYSFNIVCWLSSNNHWLYNSQGAYANSDFLIFGAGQLDLGGTLDRIQINTTTSAVFATGVAKLRYWSN